MPNNRLATEMADQLEEKLLTGRKDKKDTKMKVSGKHVFKLQEIIKKRKS